jgi:uncharacterized protein
MIKKTLVLGASLKPDRYSHIAIHKLVSNNVPVVAVGRAEGVVGGITIQKPFPQFDDIHTVTIYLSAKNQISFYDYILGLKPVRVIFNPGSENRAFGEMLEAAGVEVEYACTLIMLSVHRY